MIRLAIETSTRLGGLALADDEDLIGECILSVRATHSETVLPEIERLLDRAGLEVEQIGALVIGAGPGSFTGVRIAASLAKGLCAATGAPLFAYSSLAAVAVSAGDHPVCALFDARRNQVYAEAHRPETLPEPVLGPIVLGIDDLLASLDASDGWRFAGEGALRHERRLRSEGWPVLPPHLGVPRASGLLHLAVRWPDAGRVREPGLWEPTYVRASGAERAAARAVSEAR